MRIERGKNQLLFIVLTVGFFVGILYENLFAGKAGTAPELFQKTYLKHYLEIKVSTGGYFWYVFKERLVLICSLLVLGLLKWKKAIAIFCLGFLGFLFGILSVSAVLSLGIGGLFLCIFGLLPHGICYGLAMLVLLYHWYRYQNRKWDRVKILFVGITL